MAKGMCTAQNKNKMVMLILDTEAVPKIDMAADSQKPQQKNVLIFNAIVRFLHGSSV